MPDEPTRAVNPVAANGQAGTDLAPTFGTVFGREDRPMYLSFNPATEQGGRLLEMCEEASDESLRELANLKIKIEHVYAKVFDYTNPTTGEVYPLLRICLVTPDGKVHGCCADGVRESINRLVARHKLPPWKPAVEVTVKMKPTKKGFNRLVLLEYDTKAPTGRKP